MLRLLPLLLAVLSVVGAPAQSRAQQDQSETRTSVDASILRVENATELDLLRLRSPDWLDWSEDLDLAASQAPQRSVLPANGPAPLGSALRDSDATVSAAISSAAAHPLVANALGTDLDVQQSPVRTIPTVVEKMGSSHRVVRYEVPLDDLQTHSTFAAQGYEGQLVDIPAAVELDSDSSVGRIGTRLQRLFSMKPPPKIRVVRYDVPADNIALHREFSELDAQLLEPGMLRLPEVRFFQPKARVFMDLKRKNDGEFDLFSNGAILASLDVVELYFPMPLISERFARAVGKTNRLSQLGWRVGGTVGLGITTALNNGSSSVGSAPITTFSSGVRYEFPLGRPSNELITSGDPRLDQRTRVGIESGFQAGFSTNESLADSTDMGWYFGILVNTPWNSYGG